MNKRKVILLLTVIGILFLASGCTVPIDKETGKTILITTDTTFKYMTANESWFSALFVYPLSQAINWLTPKTNVALAIAIITIAVQVVLLLVTLKSNIQQQRMQEIQPEMNKIQKKYEGKTDERSKMAQAQELQNLYKKYDINPFGTILITFIQFPVIIAIYQAVQRAEAVQSGSFLGMSLEQTPLNGIKNGEFLYIALFAVMIIAQFLSMKLPQLLAERKAKKEAELQHRKYEKQKMPGGNMMYGMMGVILIVSISWPAAMTVYWTISSLVMVAKTLIVQKIINSKK